MSNKQLIPVTQLQRDNILSAKEMWFTVPPKNVDPGLSNWNSNNDNSPPDCNTICCFGGWCAWWPAFMAQGVTVSAGGRPDTRSTATIFADYALFGERYMFNPRGSHPADLKTYTRKHSDWDVVMKRINWLIRNSEVTA